MNFYNFNDLEKDFKNKDYTKLIKKINYNISKNKSNLGQLVLLGQAYLGLKLIENAITVFNHIQIKYPKYNEVNIFLGELL